MKFRRWKFIPTWMVLFAAVVPGCIETNRSLRYIGDKPLQYYKDTATSIEYPRVYHETDDDALFSDAPRSIRSLEDAEIRDMTLVEAIQLALVNSKILRTNAEFLSPGNRLLTNPDQASSIYDSAIQETEVFNGIGVQGSRRGMEDALSDFDGRFTTNMSWNQNERISNNSFSTQGSQPGSTFREETSVFNSRVEKQLGTGATLALNHNWNFTSNNAPAATRLFGSFYDGLLEAEYRQPLWAGRGTEYTRIAGPIGAQRGNISGVNRGVMIARIGQDLSLADFELQMHNLLRDVEELYWDLSLSYRTYHSEVVARDSAEKIWRNVNARLGLSGFAKPEEMQAQDSFFDAKARAQSAQGDLLSTEGRFRRLLGLTVNDGTVIRPVDEPVSAEFLPDWHMALAEGLTRRVELRKQKWKIKGLELQHKAAKSLVNPRLDFVSSYQVNGFGHNLFGDGDRDGITTQGVKSGYETMTQGNQTGWDMRLEFSMPLGFRQANAQVRNIELRLAKARAALSAQEHEISHELASVFRDLDRWYLTSESYYNRRESAAQLVGSLEVNVDRDPKLVDRLLRAQISLAQADVSYYQSLLQYNKSIADYHLKKGTLLERNNVILSEGVWNPEAYQDALRRAWARSHAFDVENVYTKPGEFVLGYMEDDAGGIQKMNHEEPALPVPPEPVPDPLNAVRLDSWMKSEHELSKPLAPVSESSRTPEAIVPVDGIETQFEVESGREGSEPAYSEPMQSTQVDTAWWSPDVSPANVAPKAESPKQKMSGESSVLKVENLSVEKNRQQPSRFEEARKPKSVPWYSDTSSPFRERQTVSEKPISPKVYEIVPRPFSSKIEIEPEVNKTAVTHKPVVRRVESLGTRSPYSRRPVPQLNEQQIQKAAAWFDRADISRLKDVAKPVPSFLPDKPAAKPLPAKRVSKRGKMNVWKSSDDREWKDSFKAGENGDGFRSVPR